MSNSNTPVESAQKVITRSKAKQDNQLAKFVDQNQIDSLKLKRSGKIKENLVDYKYKELKSLIIVNNEEMAVGIPNSQQVSLRDALQVAPLFDGSNLPFSHFIEGCMEAKAMLPTPAAQENLARLLKAGQVNL